VPTFLALWIRPNAHVRSAGAPYCGSMPTAQVPLLSRPGAFSRRTAAALAGMQTVSEYSWSSTQSWAEMAASARRRRCEQAARSPKHAHAHAKAGGDEEVRTLRRLSETAILKTRNAAPSELDDCLRRFGESARTASPASTVSYSDDDDFEDDAATAAAATTTATTAITTLAPADAAQELVWSEDDKRLVELPPAHLVVAAEAAALHRQQSLAQHAAHTSRAEELRAQLLQQQEAMQAMQAQVELLQAELQHAKKAEPSPRGTTAQASAAGGGGMARVAARVMREMLRANRTDAQQPQPQPPPQQQQQQQQPMLPSPLPSLSLAPSWSSDTVMFNGFLSHNWVSNNYP
jgi:hypothetical protein